jgi:hypothetical protein
MTYFAASKSHSGSRRAVDADVGRICCASPCDTTVLEMSRWLASIPLYGGAPDAISRRIERRHEDAESGPAAIASAVAACRVPVAGHCLVPVPRCARRLACTMTADDRR